MITLLVLTPSFALAAAAVSAPIDPPSVRRSRNGEFMTKYYPHTALKRGEHGRVSFELTVDRDGFLSSCVVTQTSGFANLDKETCDFLTKYAKLQPVRNEDGRTVSATQQGFINWQLPRGSKRLASADAATPLDPNKKICRKYPRTGSKVGHVKMCFTREEWALRERLTRDEVARIQDPSAGCGDGRACN